MLGKKRRLSGKDIQFMLRRGRKIYGGIFVFIVCPQYPQRSYTQRSVQIPVKLDKRAVIRNLLKREAKKVFLELFPGQSTQFYKVFIFVNKKSLASFKDTIATQKKTAIVEAWNKLCIQDFTLFFSRVGVAILNNSQTFSSKGKNGGNNGKRKNEQDQ